MSISSVDLDAYFERIGHFGDRTPTIATLRRLHALHPESIAFENLSPFLGEEVRLDISSLQDKLVRGGRGGYCFEQNLLFWHVLTALGFQVTGLAARVRLAVPEHIVMPRTHMLLLVNLPTGNHIADVGFGGMTLTAPLRLEPDVEQATPHEPFRLILSDSAYTLEAKVADAWKALYSFDLQAQLLPDYEVRNWYTSTHPQSRFVTGLMLARPETDRRHALLNNMYSIHHLHGETERSVLGNVEDLRNILQAAFQIRLPDAQDLDRKLTQLLAAIKSAK